MKKPLFFFFLLVNTIVNAQDYTVEHGDEFETPAVVWYKESIESDDKGFYFIRNKNGIANKYIYHKIDAKTGKTVFIKETDFPLNGKVYNCNGKILFFSYAASSGIADIKHKIALSMTEVNSDTGDKIGETIEIDYLETKNSKQIADIDISFSPDKTKLLVTSEIKEDKKLQRVVCRLYEVKGYKRIWEKEPVQVYKNSSVSSSQYTVDNEGNLYYIFGYVRSNHKNEFDQYDNINYATVLASSYNAHVEIIEIKSPNKKIENIHSSVVNGKYVCEGHFSDGEIDIDKNAKRGFFVSVINAKDLSVQENFTYIDEKVENTATILKEKFGNFIQWKKSEVFMLNNAYYFVKQKVYPYPPVTYDDILVMKYTTDFKLEWMKLIPKMTYSEKENGLNFLVTDKLNFVYYENLKNIEKFPDTDNFKRSECTSARYDKDPIVIATIDAFGKVTRKALDIKDQVLLESHDYKDYQGNYLSTVILPVRISSKRKRYDLLIVK